MVNEPLRAWASRRFADPAMLERVAGREPSPFGIRHGHIEIASRDILRDGG
jgi:hypothetical protein